MSERYPDLCGVFCDAVKYVGVFIGPQAHTLQYSLALEGFKEVVHFLRSIDNGYTATCSLFNILALPKLTWLASFVEPPPLVLHEVRCAVNRLSRGPWNAFHYRFALGLKNLGLELQVADIKKGFHCRSCQECSYHVHGLPAVSFACL